MYFLYYAELSVVPEGELVEDHAVEGHAERPDVCDLAAEAVYVGVAALWRHEVVGAFCFANLIFFFFGKELTNPEISQFRLEFLSYQYILWLYVSMDNVIYMH